MLFLEKEMRFCLLLNFLFNQLNNVVLLKHCSASASLFEPSFTSSSKLRGKVCLYYVNLFPETDIYMLGPQLLLPPSDAAMK